MMTMLMILYPTLLIFICNFNTFTSGFLTSHSNLNKWTLTSSNTATCTTGTCTPTRTSSTSTTTSSLSAQTNSQHIHQAFQIEANKVVKENDAKATNIELARRGQQFTPYNRRFDYMNLDSNPSQPSIWKRKGASDEALDQLKNMLLVVGVQKSEAAEMMLREREHETIQILQSFQIPQTSSSSSISRSALTIDDAVNFSIQFQGLDVLDVAVKYVANQKLNRVLQVRHRWEGDVYVTEAFMEETVFFRMDRELKIDIRSSNGTGDGLVMKVRSVLSLEENAEPVTCTEEFIKARDYEYHAERVAKGDDSMILGSAAQRVPGCIANVNVRTELVPVSVPMSILQSQEENQESYQVIIDGEADAILSRGLLSMLQMALYRMDVDSVLSIDPSTVTDELQLRNVLSKGRNDGLASIMTVIQQQIQDLRNGDDLILNEEDNEPNVSVNNAVETPIEDKQSSSTPEGKRPTVAMLLSGGVDSSVALNLLVRQGYDVTAFYLKIWLEDELAHLGQCPWEDDYNVCIQICEQAGVPLESISLQREYKEKVMSYTLNEAKKGRTPNPDIMCNSRVKFGCFYDAISKRDFEFVATGHYAQLVDVENTDGAQNSGWKKLLRAPDPVKDQSYFLAALTQAQLKRVIFPIGQFEKSRVRELAQEFDLPNKNRPDSQGLCFLGKVKFDQFLAEYLGTEPGDIIDAETQEIIGRHRGIWYHTVGQRKGIGKVLDPLATSRGPWYVVAKDTSKRLIIASNQYDEAKFESTRKEFSVEDIQWITNSPPSGMHSGVRLTMKIRHGPTIVDGHLSVDVDNVELGKIILDKKDGGLAPGQFRHQQKQ
eukprot:scaffold3493_cov205-Chaetoceros_neogracile.AAC.2